MLIVQIFIPTPPYVYAHIISLSNLSFLKTTLFGLADIYLLFLALTGIKPSS